MYRNAARQKLAKRGATRTTRHGNWRQTYVDCAGMCIANVNGSGMPCGCPTDLELHEIFGENGHRNDPKFQQRVLLCNVHHAMVEDRAHQAEFIMDQYHRSCLAEDISIEILLAGGYPQWVKKYHLDDSRYGCLLFSGPHVDDVGDG